MHACLPSLFVRLPLLGACEESTVRMSSAATGELVAEVDMYPDRSHSSLYVQVGVALDSTLLAQIDPHRIASHDMT